MAGSPSRPSFPQWVRILELHEDYRFKDLFRVVRARLQFHLFDGQLSEPVTRLNFERGNSVGVVLYDPARDAVVLVRQFRYPVFATLPPEEQAGEGARKAWLLEVPAGVQEAVEEAEEVARREVLEEAGYDLAGELKRIATLHPSPGGSSERVALFLAEIDLSQRSGQGGGLAAEGEDVELVSLPLTLALQMADNGEITDAKTVVGLQYLAARKARPDVT